MAGAGGRVEGPNISQVENLPNLEKEKSSSNPIQIVIEDKTGSVRLHKSFERTKNAFLVEVSGGMTPDQRDQLISHILRLTP